MFDAIAERYDLVNGIVAMGMDTGWRRRCVAALDLPPGSDRAGRGVRDGRPVPGPCPGRVPTGGRRPFGGHAFPCPHQRPAGAGRRPARPLPRRPLRRGGQRLRLAQRRRPGITVRGAGPPDPPRQAASPCSTWALPRPASSVSATASGPITASPWWARCSPTPTPTATCPAASPTCLLPTRWSGCSSGPASGPSSTCCFPGASASCTSPPGGTERAGGHDLASRRPARPMLLLPRRPAAPPPAGHGLEAAPGLCAVTVPVSPDLLGDVVRAGGAPGRRLWSRSDMSLLGRGEALRLPLPAGLGRPRPTPRSSPRPCASSAH